MSIPEDLVAEIIAKYKGDNKELMIYRHGECDWSAELDNPVVHVCLGESTGKISVRGPSMLDVLMQLHDAVNAIP